MTYPTRTYDAVIAGGGISGIAAACSLSETGLRVALTETSGVLGKEITRRCFGEAQLIKQYAELSPAMHRFCQALEQRQGWFGDQLDPVAAAVAFDDMMRSARVEVLFHVWAGSLLTAASSGQPVATGIDAAGKPGSFPLRAPIVIDASPFGKISGEWLNFEEEAAAASSLRLTYSGIEGELPATAQLLTPSGDELNVQCRRTFWSKEWRVVLSAAERLDRSQWLRQYSQALPQLKQAMPALASGALAHAADEVWETPPRRLVPAAPAEEIAGYLLETDHSESTPTFALPVSAISRPETVRGLYFTGPWTRPYPFFPAESEAAIINAFLAGEIVAAAVIAATDALPKSGTE